MPAKLLTTFALSALAILLCSFAPSQTLAISVQAHNKLARELPNHHRIVKKKKRHNTGCRPRPTSSCVPPSDTPAPQPTNPPEQGDDTSTSPLPPSTTTSTDPPSTSPTNTPSGPGKLGIAWAMGDDERVKILLASPRVKIFHLWGVDIPDKIKKSGIPVSIMLWDLSEDHIKRFDESATPGYATHAYGFNEVDIVGQANMDVSSALGGWRDHIRPLAERGYILGSPCTSSAPRGFDWMIDFVQQCGPDCHIDEMPIHWYDVSLDGFKEYVKKWHDAFKKPLRITEYAFQNFNGGDQLSMAQVLEVTEGAIRWLEEDERVLSYAPFGFMDDMSGVNENNRLFSDDGVNELGWHYLNGY